jgi:hypothetical protein
MMNLAKIFAIAVACLAVSDVASAIDPRLPFVSVTLPQKPVNLGVVWGPGTRRVGAQFVARVVANCPYHIEASFQGFKHERGRVMDPKHLAVAINGAEVPVGTGRTPIAQSAKPTPSGGVDVPVDLQMSVSGLESCPAGRYNGALVVRVMARP